MLVKYHAEGDRDSEFVKAEMAQIESTIMIELEISKRSWWEMVATAGMRRRVIIGSFLGLFTQWSGNTLISYYLSSLLELIGYTDPKFKGKLNVGLNAWSLVNAVTISLFVRRFPRRVMYLTCTVALLCCYVGWTISMQQFLTNKTRPAAIATIFFIFAYSPCYNIGYNALTYSKSILLLDHCISNEPSLPRRTLPLRSARSRYHHLPVLWSWGWLFHHLRESHWPQEYHLEVACYLLLLARVRERVCLLHVPRDLWTHTRGAGILV